MHFQFPLLTVVSLALSALAAGPTTGFKNEVLQLHNKARAQYGARPLTWSDALYPATLQWANTCRYQHSQSGGKYGEVLYAGKAPDGTDIATADIMAEAMNAWMSEAAKYDYANPGFSGATGDFTQVVWKSTTQVACAEAVCRSGTVFSEPSKYIVCRYTPPGNFQGKFEQNVGRHV